ncbi:MAG: CDP-glycerol glycerophosphotransferase family protein [Brevinema sp.]
MKQIKNAIKKIFHFITFMLSITLGKLWKIDHKKDIMIICDRWNEARDNGFALFEYLRKNYPEKQIYYIFDIRQQGIDYQKVKEIGNIIAFKSITMYVYLYYAKYIASSHTDIMWFYKHFIGDHLWAEKTTCFLQHGVIKDKLGEYLAQNIGSFDLIISGSALEYQFLLNETEDLHVKPIYTGLARWDRHHHSPYINNNQILIMPTWRTHLVYDYDTPINKRLQNLKTTDYFLRWQNLLNSKKVHSLLEQSNISFVFYAHPNLYNVFGEAVFSSDHPMIKIANPDKDDLTELISNSAMLITDFSSVFWEFAYLERPVIYYQFDEADFRKNQYAEGYFNYRRDGFGPVFVDEDDILNSLEKYIENEFKVEDNYIQKTKQHFILYDDQNSERNYQAIINFKKEKTYEQS